MTSTVQGSLSKGICWFSHKPLLANNVLEASVIQYGLSESGVGKDVATAVLRPQGSTVIGTNSWSFANPVIMSHVFLSHNSSTIVLLL